MNRPGNQKQQEEKKNPAGKIVAVVIVLVVIAAAVMIGIRIPDTMELERQMDAAALAISNDGVTALAGAIEQHPRAANRAGAVLLVNEMIGVMVSEAVPKTDFRTLESIEKELNENTAWKPYASEANRKILADAWNEVIRRMQEEHDKLVDLKAVALWIQNAPVPRIADIAEFYDFKLPAGFAAARPVQMATAFAAAVCAAPQRRPENPPGNRRYLHESKGLFYQGNYTGQPDPDLSCPRQRLATACRLKMRAW